MHLRDETGRQQDPIEVELGNIRCDDEVHVAVYVWHEFKEVGISWSSATERGQRIEFYADDAYKEQFVQPMEVVAQTGLPGS